MTKLSVNINKLATLRNSRGKNLPDVLEGAKKMIRLGAHGITVHPRPDGRHIRREDVLAIASWLKSDAKMTAIEFNIEGYPSEDFLQLIKQVGPHQCTLVPDPPEALTSNAGWSVARHEAFLARTLAHLHQQQVRASLFVEPAAMTAEDWQALERLRPARVELYTEAYADAFGTAKQDAILRQYRLVAERARTLGIGVNAGHDLNQRNLGSLLQAIPWLEEVSIGHALICEALDEGFAATIQNYLHILKESA